MSARDAIVGCLLGTAVGDALGLCCEGLSPRRQQRLFGPIDRYHFLFGHGMTSDDTEHTCMSAQALIVSAGDPGVFARSLSWRLRFWLLGISAGIGLATLRGIIRLWLGFPPDRSGVWSAGNGPAMRSALLGVCAGDDLPRLRALVRATTRLTHTDPRAEAGALAIALAADWSYRDSLADGWQQRYVDRVREVLGADASELLDPIEKAAASAVAGEPTLAFAAALGLERGVTGYVLHTVPVVLHSWFWHADDYRAAVTTVIACGGDTDTTAAIVGAIVGVRVAKAGIPAEWLARLCEWPRTVGWMEQLGQRLADGVADGVPRPALPLSIPALLLRNLLFLGVVLLHGCRRLLPPW